MTALITGAKSKMVRNTELAFRELCTEGVALGGHDHDLHFQSRQPRRCVVLSSGSRSACGLRSASLKLTGPEMLSHHYLSSVSDFTLHCVRQQTRTGPWFILETTRTKCSCVASNMKPLGTLIPVTTITPSWNITMQKKYLQISKPWCFSKLKLCQFLGPSPSRVGRLQSDAAGGPAPAELTMAMGTDRWGGGTGGVPPAHGALLQGMVQTPTQHLANLL